MNIRRILLSSTTTDKLFQLADNVADNKVLFKEIADLYCAGPYRITQRAAHVLERICVQHPHLIRPHLKRLVRELKRPEAPVALKRNTIRLFQFIDIPHVLRGELLDLCFGFLQDKKEPVAVKVFSMSVIAIIAKNEPGLLTELRIVIEDLLPYSGPAFRSRALRVLKTVSEN